MSDSTSTPTPAPRFVAPKQLADAHRQKGDVVVLGFNDAEVTAQGNALYERLTRIVTIEGRRFMILSFLSVTAIDDDAIRAVCRWIADVLRQEGLRLKIACGDAALRDRLGAVLAPLGVTIPKLFFDEEDTAIDRLNWEAGYRGSAYAAVADREPEVVKPPLSNGSAAQVPEGQAVGV